MTARLALIVIENDWQIEGYAASRNMPELGQLSMHRFCAFVQWWAVRNAEKQADIDKFQSQLWRPPPGVVGQGPWSSEAETAGLSSLKASLGV